MSQDGSSSSHKRTTNKRLKEGAAHTVHNDALIGGEIEFKKNPAFIGERKKIFDELIEAQNKKYQEMPRQKISIVLPDGKVKEGTSFETTAIDIAKSISNSLAEKLVVAKVKFLNRVGTLDSGIITGGIVDDSDDKTPADTWELYDCFRPFEGDCEIKLLTFDDPEGKMVFWHSSAHILGESMEREFGVHLCHGPPTDSGFFYDAYCGKKNIFNHEHYKTIEEAAKKIVSEKQNFQRIILSKEEALHLFAYNPFKVQLIETKIPDGGKVTAYRNGDLIDLCTGPHVPVTSRIKAFKVMKNSSSYWLGKATNDSL
jgi:threonyl-tRNA synthetase